MISLPLAAYTLSFYGLTLTLHAWKLVGLAGSFIFGARFVIQWIASERARKSIIPFGFWECSVLGSFLLLCYWAIHKHDWVGVLQNIAFPIYLRNLYFRYSDKKPKHPGNQERPAEDVPVG